MCAHWSSISKAWPVCLQPFVAHFCGNFPSVVKSYHPKTNYHSWFLTPQSKLQRKGLSCRKMHFPTENALQKISLPLMSSSLTLRWRKNESQMHVSGVPWPSNPCFFREKKKKKARAFPEKSKGFSLRGTPKILGKERKNAPKSKEKQGKRRKQGKRTKTRIAGSSKNNLPFTGWPWFGSVRLQSGGGTVRAVPVFGSSMEQRRGFFCASVKINRGGRFRFRFLKKRFRRFRFRVRFLGKTVPTVLVSGSGTVLEPQCIHDA